VGALYEGLVVPIGADMLRVVTLIFFGSFFTPSDFVVWGGSTGAGALGVGELGILGFDAKNG